MLTPRGRAARRLPTTTVRGRQRRAAWFRGDRSYHCSGCAEPGAGGHLRVRSELHDNLNALRAALPRLAAALRLETGELLAAWCKAVDSRLLARFDPAFPLVAAVCGGGS